MPEGIRIIHPFFISVLTGHSCNGQDFKSVLDAIKVNLNGYGCHRKNEYPWKQHNYVPSAFISVVSNE